MRLCWVGGASDNNNNDNENNKSKVQGSSDSFYGVFLVHQVLPEQDSVVCEEIE